MPIIIEMGVQLSGSAAHFDKTRQHALILAVADATAMEWFRVTITSVTDIAEASAGTEVKFTVRVPNGDLDLAPPILAALTAHNLQTSLAAQGVPAMTGVVKAARIIQTLTCGGGCAADCSPSSARSGTLHLGEGMFSGSGSAGSGDVYLNDQECWWLIEAPAGEAAHLAVTGFHTEDGYDYVSVYSCDSAEACELGIGVGTGSGSACSLDPPSKECEEPPMDVIDECIATFGANHEEGVDWNLSDLEDLDDCLFLQSMLTCIERTAGDWSGEGSGEGSGTCTCEEYLAFINDNFFGSNSDACRCNLQCGAPHQIGLLHGRNKPACSSYSSASGFLLVKFSSDGSVREDGFDATWSVGPRESQGMRTASALAHLTNPAAPRERERDPGFHTC